MNVLIKNITIVDSISAHHGSVADLHIHNGTIAAIGNNLEVADCENYDGTGLCIAPGLVDMRVTFGEPGMEHRETISSGSQAALYGGITDVLMMPTTVPALDNHATVSHAVSIANTSPIHVHIAGGVTHKLEGKDIAEMYDMANAGAVAYCDAKRSIQNAHLLQIAMNYAHTTGKIIMHYCQENSLVHSEGVNESAATMACGFKGSSNMSEWLAVQRTIAMAQHLQVRVHISCISTSETVSIIREAKAAGVAVTCDVAIHSLILSDEHIGTFDSNFKVLPPLRTKNDIEALIAGLQDNTIDCIVSDHTPLEVECKNVEFDFAQPGIIGVQTLFGLAHTYLAPHISTAQLLDKMGNNARGILQLPLISIAKNNTATMTIFSDSEEWIVTKASQKSLAHNSPFVGWRLKGKPKAVVVKGNFIPID